MTNPNVGLDYLFGLGGLIALGAVIPVVPTGAAVSAAAAFAEADHLALIALVVAFGAAGAYVGDLATYAVLRLAGERAADGSGRLAGWLHRRRQEAVLGRVKRQLDAHEMRTLVLSRLVPGGQLPVLAAAAVGGYSWRRYAAADVAAVTLWSIMYAATGLAGRAVFPKQWEGVAAGVSLVVLISLASTLYTRRHRSDAHGTRTAADGARATTPRPVAGDVE